MKSKWRIKQETIQTSDLAKTIDAKLKDMENPTTKDFLEAFAKTLTDKVAEGYRVNVRDVGSFYPVKWETRTCTFGKGDVIIEGRNIVMYRASRNFKEKVKNYEEDESKTD